MEPKENPRVLRLTEEAEVLISRIEDRLSHVLLPSYPVPNDMSKPSSEEAQSLVTMNLRRIVRRLGEIADRIEG